MSWVSWGRSSDPVGRRDHRARRARSAGDMAIDVEQLQPRRLQALHDHRGEARQEVVAEVVVLPRTCRAGSAVERDRVHDARARARRTSCGRGGPARTSRARRRRGASRSSARRAGARRSRARRRRGGSRRTRPPARPRAAGSSPSSKTRFAAQPAIRSSCSAAIPSKAGTSASSSSIVRIAAAVAEVGRADRRRLLGDVDRHRAPGDAAAAADAARGAELVDPGGELVRHPLAVARLRRTCARCRRGCRSARA